MHFPSQEAQSERRREAALREVGGTDGGIIVRGARILATPGPFADELAARPGQPSPKDAMSTQVRPPVSIDRRPIVNISCRAWRVAWLRR